VNPGRVGLSLISGPRADGAPAGPLADFEWKLRARRQYGIYTRITEVDGSSLFCEFVCLERCSEQKGVATQRRLCPWTRSLPLR